jgi:hypothetical protein
MLSLVAGTNFISWRLAPSMCKPIGTPCPSVSRLRLTPSLPRSVGLGWVFFPERRCPEGTRSSPYPRLANPPKREPTIVPATLAAGLTAVPAATSAPAVDPRPVGTPVARIIDIATPAAKPTTAAAGATWQTYQSVSGGHIVEYPVGWTIQEQAGADGVVTTTFTPSGGGAGITVAVQPAQPDQQEPLDLPNTRCQQVLGNRGIATRCLDTIALSISTTFISQGRSYTISTEGEGMDQQVYQHVLDSFRAAAPATGQPQADLEPLLLQPGDLPDTAVITAQAEHLLS